MPARTARRAALVAPLAVLAGCTSLGATEYTRVEFNEARAVAVLPAGGSAPIVAAPGGPDVLPNETVLASNPPTSPDAHGYEVRAVQGDKPHLRWLSDLPLVVDTAALVRPDGAIESDAPARGAILDAAGDPTAFRLAGCTSLTRHYHTISTRYLNRTSSRSVYDGLVPRVDLPCAPAGPTDASVRFVLETPWSNVHAVRAGVRHDRAAPLAVMAFFSVVLGIPAGVLIGEGLHPPAAAPLATGIVLASITALIDGAVLPAVFVPDIARAVPLPAR